jgi:uncharacterized protein YdeI (YjbR/CyaY-like superfamily)
MTRDIETYFLSGCGRCSLGGTPACKVHQWEKELKLLRNIVSDCGLTEEVKWGQPCYTYRNQNVLLIGAFKESCLISFFKGTLLSDPMQILISQGEHVQGGRIIKFAHFSEILAMETTLKEYIYEAIEIERAGLKITLKKTSDYPVPDELVQKFEENASFKEAFYALTPGRQRGYLLHFSAPKQSITRTSRIEKSMPDIFNGRGMHDK